MNAIDAIDGRTARRNRNRDAVLDALIALAEERNEEPTIENIAERAGVSYRSVYRYFDNRTDLMVSAITRVIGPHWQIFDIENLGQGLLDERSQRLITVRLAAYRKVAPLARSAVHRRATEPLVAEGYDRAREHLRDQLAHHFEPELSAMPVADRHVALAALDTMFQFEALDYLATHGRLAETDLAIVLSRHIRAHLTGVYV